MHRRPISASRRCRMTASRSTRCRTRRWAAPPTDRTSARGIRLGAADGAERSEERVRASRFSARRSLPSPARSPRGTGRTGTACWQFDVKDSNGRVLHWVAETNPRDMTNQMDAGVREARRSGHRIGAAGVERQAGRPHHRSHSARREEVRGVPGRAHRFLHRGERPPAVINAAASQNARWNPTWAIRG